MKNIFNLLLILLILNLGFINCKTVTFNSQSVQCTDESSPCNLASSKNWEQNEIPSDGDDVVIDFSTINLPSANIYLIAENLNIQLNSLALTGQESFKTSLNIQNSNVTVSKSFNTAFSTVNLTQQSDFNIRGAVDSSFGTTDVVYIFDGSNLYVPCGLSFNSSSIPMDGTIFISEDSVSNQNTKFLDVNQPNLSVSSNSNLTIISSTLNSVSMNSPNIVLNSLSRSYFSSLNSLGQVNIPNYGSLELSNSSASSASTINLGGSLTVRGDLNVQQIVIGSTGVIYNYGNVNTDLSSLSGSIIYHTPTAEAKSINIQDGSLVLYNSILSVSSDFKVSSDSVIKFFSCSLDNTQSYIQVKGTLLLDSIDVVIQLSDSNILPSDGDRILLVSAPSVPDAVVKVNSIKFYTQANTNGLTYKVEYDNGNVYLVFNNSGTNGGNNSSNNNNNNNNNNSSNNNNNNDSNDGNNNGNDKKESNEKRNVAIGVSIGTVVGAILLLTVIGVMVRNKRRGEKRPLLG
ncbi:hypothetical protein DICPUDRAFT_77130 [Dictyostelium purpureum]|uniref:Auto-transporter adhesin head GIN domain-containing protein n=1 Tax=Dictyostelium purpureum TaxID=5786 RepID=F0ZFP3_DICPU|nr:uncharacterized protein DICPUDRAFT_77130 [Dictyostelium purpureum]EGC37269.1 hypothetical protein DICPUDRAFT_77130 [Dictyostelium purpureum]|eukprot:XP_003286239.1 hypothetical protein DICPUDRAFT_77130 [Dictyostelium purpureum]